MSSSRKGWGGKEDFEVHRTDKERERENEEWTVVEERVTGDGREQWKLFIRTIMRFIKRVRALIWMDGRLKIERE